MPIEYRNMRPSDEDAILDLWLETWKGVDRERARTDIRTDPDLEQHTFVATGDDGLVLASTHYWVHLLGDASGEPRPVGCVSHVATRESARRQGHARALMALTTEAMRAEGCDWTLLYSSDMGKPLYPLLGYEQMSAPYRRGLVKSRYISAPAEYVIRRYDSLEEAGGVEQLMPIYEAYNATRPLCVVRDSDYWRKRTARRVDQAWGGHGPAVFLARRAAADVLCGYAFAQFSSQEFAQAEFQLDQVFTVSELGVLPGDRVAARALLSAAAAVTTGERTGGRVFLPYGERVIDDTTQEMFGDTLQQMDDRSMMACPLREGMTMDDVKAIFAAPGAMHWLTDEF